MNSKRGLWVVFLMLAALFQGCDSNEGLLDDDQDTRPLNPTLPQGGNPDAPKPPADAEVISTSESAILDVAGQPVIMRGANITYADAPEDRIKSFAAAKSVNANVVRVKLTKDTSVEELRVALDTAVEQGLIAMLTFWGPEGEIECTRSNSGLQQAVETYWLDEWMPVLAEAKYQPHLMLNIASKWGPPRIFDALASKSYGEYIETYTYFIGEFRKMGFKVPLVIDAPGCGEDHYAFMAGRADSLLAADPEQNIVLSVHAYGASWNSKQNIQANISDLQRLGVPFVITEFGGLDESAAASMNYNEFMEKGEGDYSAIIDLPWASGDDYVSFSYPLPEAKSGIEVPLKMDVFLPQVYVLDGNLSLQMYLLDASGNVGFYPATKAETKLGNRWNRLTGVAYALDDFVEMEGDFTGENITHVGLRIKAEGKPSEVFGDIKIDNIDFGGDLEPLYQARFALDTEGWIRGWGAPVNTTRGVYQEDGVLNILPDWGATDGSGSPITFVVVGYTQASSLEPAINVREGFVLSFDVFIPEEYADEELALQPFLQDDTNDRVFAGVDYISYDSNRFRFGEWNRLEITMDDFEDYVLNHDGYDGNNNFDFDAGIYQIGLQVNGVTEAKQSPISIDNFVIDRLDSLAVGATNAYLADFESGTNNWYYNAGGDTTQDASVAQQTVDGNGVLALLPIADPGNEGNNRFSVQINFPFSQAQKIELGYPFEVSYKIFIPSEYSDDTSLAVQSFLNGSGEPTPAEGWDGSWVGFASFDYTGIWKLNVGGWTTIRLSFSEFAAPPLNGIYGDFYPEFPPKATGIQIVNADGDYTAPILIDDFKIDIIYPSEDEAIVIDFSTQEQLDQLLVDQAASLSDLEWLPEPPESVVSWDYGVDPFGWISWVWVNGDSEWNLANSDGFIAEDPEQGVDFTDRGDDIVNGTYGIMNTSSEVNFSP